MIGVPMPPTPDEPNPRMVQRPEERQPWSKQGVRLGEASEREEYAAAIRTAAEIIRMLREAKG